MILLVAVILGLVAGYVRAWLAKQPYALPVIQRVELAVLAFLPQALVFYVPQTDQFVSQQWTALILLVSLGILVLFVWFNRRLQGFWLLGLGLLLNLAVIAANGGLMPVSPETLTTVYGTHAEEIVESRSFGTKGIVLTAEETRLEWLADRFTLPDWLPIQFAYSLGDVFLVAGAFWVLWTGAGRHLAASAVLESQSFLSQSQSGV